MQCLILVTSKLVVVGVLEGVGVDVVPHDLNVFVVDALSTKTNDQNEKWMWLFCQLYERIEWTNWSIYFSDFIRSVCLFLLPFFLPSKDRQGQLKVRLVLQTRQSLFSGREGKVSNQDVLTISFLCQFKG